VAFSKEFRYRNLGARKSEFGADAPPNYLIIGVVSAVIILFCGCLGVIIGLKLNGAPIPNPLAARSSTPVAKVTATPNANPKAVVPLKTKGLNENGLELTVSSFQRPLQVQGLAKIDPNQQFVLATVQVHNTKATGQPIKLDPANFKIKGDGGLVYEANPRTITIENLMTAQDQVGPAKDLERELIFQIAKDDSGLQLFWTVGQTTRIFQLELDK
jgi:hypothetical protein